MKTKCLLYLATLPLLLSSGSAATVFTNGSTWKYFLGTAEASTPIDAWRALGFNDSAWASGLAPVGYGEPDVRTAVPTSSAGGYTTIYLRKTINIPDASAVTQLELTVQIDDGAVVWLNTQPIGRTNVASAEPAFDGLASSAPTQWYTHNIVLNATTVPTLASVLQTGTNILAVHLLNGSSGSSDIYWDAMLVTREPDPIPPTILSVNPNPGSTLNQLTEITVTFSEPVSGVDASDLLLNGVGATLVTGAGAVYNFSFGQPAFGNVSVTWLPGHGIQDQAIPPNGFNGNAPGHTWNYTLIDNLPPTVVLLNPQIGATVPALTQIEVNFSEAVTGVNAADLLINGAQATNMVASSSTQFTFQFTQPPTGTVSVAWISGHGITDLAASPNVFAGGAWTYRLDPTASAADAIITEFMASNTRTLADEDGEYSDWIEIHNPGAIAINLLGWSLTDTEGDYSWTFPSTNLQGGGYMIVFASSKNRTIAGAPIHTDFRLTGSGEYLALASPEGRITSEFNPFDSQVADVSYGLHQSAQNVSLVHSNSAARVLVPTSGALALTWTDPSFSDAGWLLGTNSVGFEAVPGEPGQTPYGALIRTDIRTQMHNQNSSAYIRLPFQVNDPTKITSLMLQMRHDDGFVAYLNGAQVASRNAPVSGLVADSVAEFAGTQGQDNWFYGYYNVTTDGVAGYQTNDFTLFPKDGGPHSAANYWNGSIWDWFAGNPPWTELNPQGGHPNGSNNGNVHWAMRRWQSEVNGTIRVTLRLAKSNASCGNGITGRIFHNGGQVYNQTIAFSDAAGINTTVTLNGVQIGDFIDFAIDPLGTDATTADGCDGSLFSATIEFQAPDLAWNSSATAARPNSAGREFESFPLNNAAQWLIAGDNVLALHGLNVHATNADFLAQALLDATIPQAITEGSRRYFALPTPGGPNGTGVENLGPIITEVNHIPSQPLDNQNLYVSARITPALASISSNTLVYRVMFGTEVSVPMFDDGAHGDGAEDDGIFGTLISPSASTPNQMVRWYISARDVQGRTSRWPIYADPLTTPQYLGTVVADPNLTNPLPVLHWFLANATGADSDAGTRASLFFLGRFYDNVYMNLHGQSSRGFPKRSYDVEFNPGYRFTYHEGVPAVSDVNWLTTYPDKAHMRNQLAYEAFASFGVAHHWVEPVRVHRNAAFYGTAHLVENGDDEFVERLGLNPNNALYKVYNTFTTSPAHATLGVQNVEKKTRKFEGSADLQALLNGVLLTGEARRAFIYDNIDVPQMLNSMATRALIGEQDCCHKNYYFYRDTLGDGEWEIWPWDVDLSYGRRWIGASTYWDDAMIFDTSMPVGGNNALLSALYGTTEISEMYWRRQRTLMDEFLQAPGTPVDQLRIERRIDALVPIIAPDAALDLTAWGTWCCAQAGPFSQATIPQPTSYQTLPQAANLIKTGYLPQRRNYLYNSRTVGAGGPIPNAQPPDARILIAQFEANPASGNQAQEYLVLTNFNNYAVDISGWRLAGAIDFTFKPGTVIPAGRLLYVSPNVNAFRARTTGPRAGQSIFVVGNYQGQLSARGETVQLLTRTGRLVDYWNYPANPSAAQNFLRVTEIMYHPSPLTGNTNSPEEFEFIEVRNLSGSALNLAGVRFVGGISFNFSGSLASSQSVVVVKNLASFTARYPSVPGSSIAGVYTGSLDNGGERIQLVDAAGEEILDFEYNNTWYPITDGLGFSLVVVAEHAEPDAWSDKAQWRAGGTLNGSPASSNQGGSQPGILITEALTHTPTPPPTDSIELHNPTAGSVNVGGWYLTDDFNTPKKFRIPNPTQINAGGYVVFDESSFNTGLDGFALSSDSDEVYLFSADALGNLTGYVHGHSFGAAAAGVSFGRIVTSDGREHFVAQSARTLPGANAGPLVGPIVITEIMYRPTDIVNNHNFAFTGTTYDDNSLDEFIELRNISGGPVALFDSGVPVATWKMTGGIDFTFPTNVTLAAGESILVANFDPANAAQLSAFRARFGLSPAIRIFGPYGGKLNNNEDQVELKKPMFLLAIDPVFVMVDEVEYRDEAPWPAGADGYGYSLQRWNAAGFGNEPMNWVAAPPTAGGLTVTNTAPPQFTVEPASTTVPAGSSAALGATLAGTAPFSYQWLFNDAPITGATNGLLQFPSVGLQHAGDYRLLVYNSAGLAVSRRATLSVQTPPSILAVPTNIQVRVPPDPTAAPSTNVTFFVSAFSRSPVTYQWRRNGVDVPGATANSLTISNVNTNSLATYSVVVSDGVSSFQTEPVMLQPLVGLTIVQQPLGQEVPVSSRVTLSAQITGFPPLYTNIWQIGAQGQATNIQEGLATFYSYVAPSVASTQQYRLIVRNPATPGGRASTLARIVTLPDSDGDGIPDIWESAYGFNPSNAVDRLADTDGDGSKNWEEYVANTNPTNAASYLKIDSLTMTNGIRLEFGAISNKTYQIQGSDTMAIGDWQAVADIVARTNNRTEVVIDPAGNTNRFYRVLTPLQ